MARLWLRAEQRPSTPTGFFGSRYDGQASLAIFGGAVSLTSGTQGARARWKAGEKRGTLRHHLEARRCATQSTVVNPVSMALFAPIFPPEAGSGARHPASAKPPRTWTSRSWPARRGRQRAVEVDTRPWALVCPGSLVAFWKGRSGLCTPQHPSGHGTSHHAHQTAVNETDSKLVCSVPQYWLVADPLQPMLIRGPRPSERTPVDGARWTPGLSARAGAASPRTCSPTSRQSARCPQAVLECFNFDVIVYYLRRLLREHRWCTVL